MYFSHDTDFQDVAELQKPRQLMKKMNRQNILATNN